MTTAQIIEALQGWRVDRERILAESEQARRDAALVRAQMQQLTERLLEVARRAAAQGPCPPAWPREVSPVEQDARLQALTLFLREVRLSVPAAAVRQLPSLLDLAAECRAVGAKFEQREVPT